MLETDNPVLPLLHRQALLVRHQAAMTVVRQMVSVEERWALLAAVVAPSDPLMGLTSPTSSDTE